MTRTGGGAAWAGFVLVATVLAGCSSTDEVTDPDELPDAGPPAESAGDTDCLTDKLWVLDLADLADQVGIGLAADGLQVIEHGGVGRYTFTLAETGEAAQSANATLSITATSEQGIQITVVQTHTGEPSGEWGWVGNTNVIAFDNWDDAAYQVDNIVSVGGVRTESPIPLPEGALDGSTMEINCTPSTLSTHVPGSPYTHHWTAEG